MPSNNFHNNVWKQWEVDLILDGDYSNQQISEITGRTLCAVVKKRHVLNNPCAMSNEQKYSDIVKEARLRDLMKKIHVRLGAV